MNNVPGIYIDDGHFDRSWKVVLHLDAIVKKSFQKNYNVFVNANRNNITLKLDLYLPLKIKKRCKKWKNT